MKHHTTKTACGNAGCQNCQGCSWQHTLNDTFDDPDEWSVTLDSAKTVKTEEHVNLDQAIEVATLAG